MNNGPVCPGYYGKLPQRGDFIRSGLSNTFVSRWDKWLSENISHIRETLGEYWLDYYLQTPVWRYYISKGVVDNQAHAGIWFPSIDKAGRYFPFTIDNAFSNDIRNWFDDSAFNNYLSQLEKIGLTTLEEACDIEDMNEALEKTCWFALSQRKEPTPGSSFLWEGSRRTTRASLCQKLLNDLEGQHKRISVWWSDGEEDDSRLILCEGMPSQADFLHFLTVSETA